MDSTLDNLNDVWADKYYMAWTIWYSIDGLNVIQIKCYMNI